MLHVILVDETQVLTNLDKRIFDLQKATINKQEEIIRTQRETIDLLKDQLPQAGDMIVPAVTMELWRREFEEVGQVLNHYVELITTISSLAHRETSDIKLGTEVRKFFPI